MARINFTGFDTGTSIESTDNLNATFTNSTTLGGTGYALSLSPATGGSAYYSLSGIGTDGTADGSNHNTSYSRFYTRLSSLPGSGINEEFFSLSGNSVEILSFSPSLGGITLVLQVRINNLGRLSIYGGGGSLLGTGSTSLNTDQWYRIELYWSNSTGAAELRINGATEITVSGASIPTTSPNNWTLGKRYNVASGSYTALFDDFSIDDSTWPGNGRIVLLKPNDSGAFGDWTALAGSDWSNANEVPANGDSSYISSFTLNDVTTFVIDNTAGTVLNQSAIKSAKTVNVVRSSSGTPTIKSRLRSSNVNSDNTSHFAPGTTYVSQCVLANINPKTSGVWNSDAIDNVQTGIIWSGGSGTARLTDSYLSVEADPAFITAQGGVLGGGTAPVIKRLANINATGGARPGGTARVTTTYAKINASGGGFVAGAARLTRSYARINASGGGLTGTATFSGDFGTGFESSAAAVRALYSLRASGGIRGAGAVVLSGSTTSPGSGGVLGGSTARVTKTYANFNATGGARPGGRALRVTNIIATGGAGTASGSFTEDFSGGFETALSILIQVFHNVALTGSGVRPGGTAGTNFYDRYVGTGGARPGGTANVSTIIRSIAVTGGARLAGSGLNGKFYIDTMSSGVQIAAGAFNNDFGNDFDVPVEAIVRVNYNPQHSGGAVSGSSARVIYSGAVTGRGGEVVGGQARIVSVYRITALGGVVAAGVTKVQVDIVALGGAVAGGFVPATVEVMLVPAGVALGGTSTINMFYRQVAQGGVVAEGKGRVFRVGKLTNVKNGIGRTLAGDNILKPKQPKPLLISPFYGSTPLAPTGVRTGIAAVWCELGECNDNVLPPTTVKIQKPYLPPKKRGVVATDTQFAQVT